MIEAVGLGRASRQISERAVRRHAAAACDRAGAGAAAARAAARRAVRRARSRHARADACADQAAVARAEDDHRDGHPRHQGGVRAGDPADRARPPAPRSAGAGALRRQDHLRSRSDPRRRRAGARVSEDRRPASANHGVPDVLTPSRAMVAPRRASPAPQSRAAIIPISTRWRRKAGRRSRPKASCRPRPGARSGNGRSTWACPAPKA